MGILGRAVLAESFKASVLGIALFTFVLFLRGAGRLFELLVRSSTGPEQAARLLLLAVPPVLVFTIPVGLLAGLLVAAGRMSADGEITGLRACGQPARRLMIPVSVLAGLAAGATAACSLWLSPWSLRETDRMIRRLAAEQLTAEIQPRVFQEQFPGAILFVQDVKPGPVVLWDRIFLADLRPASQRGGSLREGSELPRITVARRAVAVPEPANNRIQLLLEEGSSHEPGADPAEYFSSYFPQMQRALDAEPPRAPSVRPIPQTDTIPLLKLAPQSVEARIELHQRFALPLACLLLALVGTPLGVYSRRSGKSAAAVTTVLIAFGYHTALISLIGLARTGRIPVWLAVWTPNFLLAVASAVLLARLERPALPQGLVRQLNQMLLKKLTGLRRLPLTTPAPLPTLRPQLGTIPILPQIVDAYVLNSLLFYFFVFLAGFVLLTHVYTFFELLSDIIRNQIPLAKVLSYLLYLTPMLVYTTAPLAAMVAVLVTFGSMAKHNELVGFKSCGISLYRLVAPVAVAGLLLSSALFAFDYYYLPEANRQQEALRAEIKGRPVQTFKMPTRPWIFGQGPRIYYFRYLDAERGQMGGVSAYVLDPASFRLRRHIFASRATWSNSLKTWVLEDGWVRNLEEGHPVRFERFQTATFAEISEAPTYFVKEVKQEKQMNFRELNDYIADLRQSGFDTVRLTIQYYKKFSAPLFVLILSLLAAPFSFMVGHRGALAGVGLSLGIAVAYWSINQLFEQIGNLNQLPPIAAAWAPDGLFLVLSVYLLATIRT